MLLIAIILNMIKFYQLKNILIWSENISEMQQMIIKLKESRNVDYKTQAKWKIQLSMTINFMSSKDSKFIPCIQRVII